MMLGQIGGAAVVGLPGNPVAVFVCFLMYVWPMLRRLGGAQLAGAAAFHDAGGLRVPQPQGRPARALARQRCSTRTAIWQVAKFERDGSGLISSLRAADCLIDIPEDVTGVATGDPLAVIPFSEYGIVQG